MGPVRTIIIRSGRVAGNVVTVNSRLRGGHVWLVSPGRRRAVSMIEVLCMMGVLALLLAMLLPSLFNAKQQARRTFCNNNLRQWGFAFTYYREDHDDHIPTEGTTLGSNAATQQGLFRRGVWFNELPPYLDMPAYRDIEGANLNIKEMKNGHVWICPAKELSDQHKSSTAKNQFHYGMNQVLDGMGKAPAGSADTPGYPDPDVATPIPVRKFRKNPLTALLFDIYPNSPAGSPRDVATKFHGDWANILLLDGSVDGFRTADIIPDGDFSKGKIKWDHSRLYWGYPPPRP